MSEFDDKNAIDELMKRVEQLNDADKQSLINSIKNMNTTNKKVEQTDEEKAAKKQATIEKRKETMARRKAEKIASGEIPSTPSKKSVPTDEEKAERKRIANEKRKATWARKKQERDNLRVVEDTSDEDNKDVPGLKLEAEVEAEVEV